MNNFSISARCQHLSSVLLVCLFLVSSIFGISAIEELDEAAVFSFAAFSDNRGEVDQNSAKAIEWIKEKHNFTLGIGDIFGGEATDTKFQKILEDDEFYHDNLYPVFGNHCNMILINGKKGSQMNWGRPAIALDYMNFRQRSDIVFREPTSKPILAPKSKDDPTIVEYDDQYIDYYAKRTIGKFTIHIVAIYKADHTPFAQRSADFLVSKVKELAKIKTDYDIVILIGHEERWFQRGASERKVYTWDEADFMLENSDLIINASDHKFRRIHNLDDRVENPALVVNSGQVYNTSDDDGYLEMHVFDGPPRFTCQYIGADDATRKLHKEFPKEWSIRETRGETETLVKPMMKVVNGPITQPVDWSKFSVEPVNTELPQADNYSFKNGDLRVSSSITAAARQVEFLVTKRSRVSLNLYDNQGKVLEQIYSRITQPGSRSISFDASRYSSGIYYMELQVGSHKTSKKFLIAR